MLHPGSPALKILVIGDWVIDDNWLIGTHRSQTAANIGLAHYRSLNLPDNVVRRLSGAGQVAALLHAALGGAAPGETETYKILGVGTVGPGRQGLPAGHVQPGLHGRPNAVPRHQ